MEKVDEHAAEDTCTQRTEQHGDFACVAKEFTNLRAVLAKRQRIDEDGHREADTAEACHSEEHLPCGVAGHDTHLGFNSDERCDGDANGFAEQQAEEHTHTHASKFRAVLEDVEVGEVGYLHTGIGECEDRHDEVVDIRVERMLQAVTHADAAFRHYAETSETVALGTIGKGLFTFFLQEV